MDNKSFDNKRIADGYANDRPWLHKLVIDKVKADCKINTPFKNGLDVGCGAGLSTKALKLICDKVTGTDISDEMIKVCKSLYHAPEFTFYTAKAEETRLPETPYDIVTAAGVVNWVDRYGFLENMRSVMAKGALLVVYDFWISDEMIENEAYTKWYRDLYLTDFPKPLRKEDVWSQKDLNDGFFLKNQVTYQMNYEFDMEAFIRFMMIQSNVNSQIEKGYKTEKEIRNWMYKTLEPIFDGNRRTLVFEGYNWYIDYR